MHDAFAHKTFVRTRGPKTMVTTLLNPLDPSRADPVYIRDPNFVMTVPVDVLAPNYTCIHSIKWGVE